MQRLLVRIGLLTLIAGLSILLLAWALLQTSIGTTFFEQRLRAQVHPQLQLNGQIKIGLLPRVSITATDVTIPSDYGPHPLASVERWRSQIAWLPLFAGQVRLHALNLTGLRLYREQKQWQPLLTEFGELTGLTEVQSQSSGTAKRQEQPLSWLLRVRQLDVQDLAVLSIESGLAQDTLLQAGQFVLRFGGDWPTWVGTHVHVDLNDLMINDATELGLGYAFVEQLGMATDDRLDVQAFASDWQIESTVARLGTGEARGSWGEFVFSGGTIALDTGEIAIAVEAKLTSSPRLTSRGLDIQVRQTDLQFELVGHWRDPGLSWLRPSAVTR